MLGFLENIFRLLIIIIPVFILVSWRNIQYKSLVFLLCYACTYGYNYELFGGISILHILLVFIVVFGDKERESRPTDTRILRNILLYIVYVSLVTILGYHFKSDYILRGSIIQNQLRPYVQIVFMMMTYLAMDGAKSLNEAKSKSILLAFYKVTCIIAFVAIIQEVVFLGTGHDIFPMAKDYGGAEGVSAITENGFLRVTAGVGEPKQLAKFLSVGITFHLICHKFLGYEKIKISHLVLFVVALLFAGSTTGLFISVAGVAVFLKSRIKGNEKSFLIGAVVFLILIPIVLNLPVVEEKFEYARKQGEIVGLENSDTAAVKFLLAKPVYSITGVGLANTVAYANEFAPSGSRFINNHPYTLRRGLIFHLSETGIIGLLFQLAIFKALYDRIKREKEIKDMFLFLGVVYFLLTLEAINQMLLIMMVLLSNCTDKGNINESLKKS